MCVCVYTHTYTYTYTYIHINHTHILIVCVCVCNIYIYIHINHTCILSIYINTSKKQLKQGALGRRAQGPLCGSGWGGITNYLQGNFFLRFLYMELSYFLSFALYASKAQGWVWCGKMTVLPSSFECLLLTLLPVHVHMHHTHILIRCVTVLRTFINMFTDGICTSSDVCVPAS